MSFESFHVLLEDFLEDAVRSDAVVRFDVPVAAPEWVVE